MGGRSGYPGDGHRAGRRRGFGIWSAMCEKLSTSSTGGVALPQPSSSNQGMPTGVAACTWPAPTLASGRPHVSDRVVAETVPLRDSGGSIPGLRRMGNLP